MADVANVRCRACVMAEYKQAEEAHVEGCPYATPPDSASASLALWAIRVLDAWAYTTRERGYPEGWTCLPWLKGKASHKCCLSGNGGRIFYGSTADGARMLAASTLVEENPALARDVPKPQASVGGETSAWEMGYESGYDDREKMDHDRADVIKTDNPFGVPSAHTTNNVDFSERLDELIDKLNEDI
jgi:hypothetical protein